MPAARRPCGAEAARARDHAGGGRCGPTSASTRMPTLARDVAHARTGRPGGRAARRRRTIRAGPSSTRPTSLAGDGTISHRRDRPLRVHDQRRALHRRREARGVAARASSAAPRRAPRRRARRPPPTRGPRDRAATDRRAPRPRDSRCSVRRAIPRGSRCGRRASSCALGDDFALPRGRRSTRAAAPRGTPIQWTVGVAALPGRPAARRGSPRSTRAGKLTTVRPADFADATFDVVATAAGRSATARCEVDVARQLRGPARAVRARPERRDATSPRSRSWRRRPSARPTCSAEDGARRRRMHLHRASSAALDGGARRRRRRRRPTRSRKGRGVEQAAEERHAEQHARVRATRSGEREAEHAAQMKRAPRERRSGAAGGRGGQAARGPAPRARCSVRRAAASSRGATTYCSFDSNRLVAVARPREPDDRARPAASARPASAASTPA